MSFDVMVLGISLAHYGVQNDTCNDYGTETVGYCHLVEFMTEPMNTIPKGFVILYLYTLLIMSILLHENHNIVVVSIFKKILLPI